MSFTRSISAALLFAAALSGQVRVPGPGGLTGAVTFALVDHNAAAQNGAATGTTPAMNSTGATLGIANVACFVTLGTLSDSKANTWVGLTEAASSAGVTTKLFYVLSPAAGSGHTVSIAGAGSCSVQVQWWSGPTAFDVQTTATDSSSSSTSMGGGTITPSFINSLIVAGGGFGVTGNTAGAASAGFTNTDMTTSTANNIGGVLSYIVETSIVAKNPLYTLSAGSKWGAGNAVFK